MRKKKRSSQVVFPVYPQSNDQRESAEIVRAIRRGAIDALVMAGANEDQVVFLQGAEHPYRLLVEAINEGAATLDLAGTVLYANNRFSEIVGVPIEKLVGTSLQCHVSFQGNKKLHKLLRAAIRSSTRGEFLLARSEGKPCTVRLTLSPMLSSESRNISVIATDLSELAEANEALSANEESLRQLSGRLLQLQDQERRKIARDLHDITGQKLALQSILLSQLSNKHSESFNEETRRIVSECATLTKQVNEEIRTLSYLLHPPLLDELGLASAVKCYAEGFESRTGMVIDVQITGVLRRLPPDIEIALFRVIQESLTNIQRYAASAKAYIRVQPATEEVKVQIGDFGKGMSRDMLNSIAGSSAPVGVGIRGMRERMRQLSGRLEILSGPSGGTVVTATVPLSRKAGKLSQASSVTERQAIGERTVPRLGYPQKRVLIADGDEIVRRKLRAILEAETDFTVCGEAVDGTQAVDKARELHADLVILDMNLPTLKGMVVMRHILRECPQTKILMFTDEDSEKIAREVQVAGAHGSLFKARLGEDLVRAVTELLGNKQFRTAVAGYGTS